MIREAVREDLYDLLNLYLFLHGKEIPKDIDALESTWNAIIEDKNHHIIVKEINGQILSSCICVIIPNLTRNIRPYALIENVVTHEEHRGKGCATDCLHYAREIAIENNCYKIMLLTSTKNKSTLAFYKNAGYNDEEKTAFIQWVD